ncbi:sugar transferase [Gemella sp. GH3]|uniref:sugar transferase n=1 Tax=unclassified Gemella TaxID=2624949 RepID=UPI0015D0C945|nr:MULTISPECIES: sugar transferase [unclassified Gemella]MBF0714044.1 sugar transferase [Gemella sp. GH3.1]NYS50996.1 sugar transferase [Gemella sp. GH3]
MRIHITNLYGHSPKSTAQLAQNLTTSIAKSLGFSELGVYAYDINADNDIEMRKRIDGIIASISQGDVVILQLPMWNTHRYEETFINALRGYADLKIVIFIHDFIPFMFEPNRYLLQDYIEIFNKADALIIPSQKMYDILRGEGLTVDKYLIQHIWDIPNNLWLNNPIFSKTLNFSGQPSKFKFCNEWNYQTTLKIFGDSENIDTKENVIAAGWHNQDSLMLELSKGGFGLVWSEDDYWSEYMTMNVTYKLSTYLAAGIPVIVKRGISNQSIIEENELGIICDTLEEADNIIQNIKEDEYYKLTSNVKKFSTLLNGGYITKKLFIDMINLLMKK